MSCSKIIVLPMEEQHLNAVAMLEQQCFSIPWNREMLAEELTQKFSLYLVAINDNGTIMGYAGAHLAADEAVINNVATAPEFRRMGVAAALLQQLIKTAEQRGAEHFYLEVRESNMPAQSLYLKFGFQPLGLRKNYYSEPTEHAVIMGKETTNHADSGN